MTQDQPSGIERAVFGAAGRGDNDGWLDRHLRDRLGVGLVRVLFRSGWVAAVYGVALADEREVAVRVHRRPADATYPPPPSAASAGSRRRATPAPRRSTGRPPPPG